MPQTEPWSTPYELANGAETTTWEACIAFYRRLADAHPERLRFEIIGTSDGGAPIHAGVFSPDGQFDPTVVKAAGRAVLFNNNGIHPGEPEGIDACMGLVRDLCLDADPQRRLGAAVFVFIAIYNVDGARNRSNTSRVNQLGPASFGFRGSARHLDLNRDFVKGASRNTQAFTAFFARWDPDVFVDTHTSNGADYPYVMTLIATQPDKLGGECGAYLRDSLLPQLHEAMLARGWPMCPYVNLVARTPEEGIESFVDTPRYSTGYAALHHCIGFMPETHMLKPFAQRHDATRALLDALIDTVREDGGRIGALRRRDRAAFSAAAAAPVSWTLDRTQASTLDFRGFRAEFVPSRIGRWTRLRYDRASPWRAQIDHFDRCRDAVRARLPRAYLLPQAWPEVAQRLRGSGVPLRALERDREIGVEAYRLTEPDKQPLPFEGEHLHERIAPGTQRMRVQARAGDWIIALGTPHDRVAFEMLEPQASDSFYRWSFFDAVLDRKETFSDYLFEDEAERLLTAEPALRAAFDAWVAQEPARLDDAAACLHFIHRHAQRWAEPEHLLYPVFRIVDERESLQP